MLTKLLAVNKSHPIRFRIVTKDENAAVYTPFFHNNLLHELPHEKEEDHGYDNGSVNNSRLEKIIIKSFSFLHNNVLRGRHLRGRQGTRTLKSLSGIVIFQE